VANWKWEGLDGQGNKAKGQIEAETKKDARKILRARGIRPKRIIPPSILEFDLNEWMVQNGYTKSFGSKEMTGMTKRLAIMINAGIPILQSLELLYKQEKHPALKKALKKIGTDVGEGSTLADAMEKQRGFSALYCNLVRAGEAGGILDEILEKLAEHMDKQEKTLSQIKSAMMYPILVVLVGIGVISAMLIFVVPQFQEMILASGNKVPAPTQMVVDASEFLQANYLYLFGGLFLLYIFVKAIKSTDEGAKLFDYIYLKMPLFGGIILKGNLSSFTRTLSTMLTAGVSLIDSLRICENTVENVIIKEDIMMLREAVTQGKNSY
jgi:type IV pilus assembly protein PilC